MARFQRNAAAAGATIVPIGEVDPHAIARFFSDHYGGVFDHRLDELQRGAFDRQLSPVITAGGKVVVCGLFRTRPQSRSIYLDILLVHPDHRGKPLAAVILDRVARWGIDGGYHDVVFEADAEHDAFATAIAGRAGSAVRLLRFRYVISI